MSSGSRLFVTVCGLCFSLLLNYGAAADRTQDHGHGSEIFEEQYYEFQRLDHFDGANPGYWKQRYLVNATYHRSGGPVFIMQGGHEALNPAWMLNGSWVMYAQTHGALLVLLEHRYYGLSRPVKNLDVANLKYLSSQQALADLAEFIRDFRARNQLHDNKVILFGGGYAGSLVTWFRSKYPYMSDGAVASSAPLVALMDFQAYFESVGSTVEDMSPLCNAEIEIATNTMAEWWGQPDKRIVMQNMFRLCDKINHDALFDYSVFFYRLATENYGYIVQNEGTNRHFLGARATNISFSDLCYMMTSQENEDYVQGYANVNSLMMDMRGETCLDIRYTNMAAALNYTSFNSSGNDGRRQWLYQRCTEFGWAKSSWGRKQPFGNMWLFPFNFTLDLCWSAFSHNMPVGYEATPDETNLYYGGLDLAVSKVVFVNGQKDPWYSLQATSRLKNSPEAEIINLQYSSHKADMYPPREYEDRSLVNARKRVSELIGKWISM